MSDSARLILARALRGFIDGWISVVLASYLALLGWSPAQIGVLVSATLLGSAAGTLGVGLVAHRFGAKRVLLFACALMAATGLGFAFVGAYAPLLVIAFAGTLNPSGGDLSLFLPTEQAALADAVKEDRASIYAWYNLAATLLGALGSLASGLPELAATHFGVELLDAFRALFLLYAALALVLVAIYLGLSAHPIGAVARAPLRQSRRRVLELSALFSLDSFGGGFTVQALLALWLAQRFDLSLAGAGAFFFAASIPAAFSQLVSARLARRIGLVNTMVYTHIPANALLVLAAFMPDLGWTLACLGARMAISQMDVPVRQAYVMAVVPPEERAAAASVTNVPRSLAGGLSPVLSGALLAYSDFGWPLVCAGVLKILYDLLFLMRFRRVAPLIEAGSGAGTG